jgi:hypothetical protein
MCSCCCWREPPEVEKEEPGNLGRDAIVLLLAIELMGRPAHIDFLLSQTTYSDTDILSSMMFNTIMGIQGYFFIVHVSSARICASLPQRLKKE